VVFHTTLFPRARTSILTSLDRITAPIADFIRGNIIVSTAAIGIGTTGLLTGIAVVKGIRKKRKKAGKGKKKRKTRAKKKTRKTRRPRKAKKRISHASPRHRGHKRVSFTTAGGKKVNFLVRMKGHAHRRRRRRK